VRAAFAHAGGLRVSWLGVAVAAEVMSLAGGAAAQRRLPGAAAASCWPASPYLARDQWT
jgi:hypothetical protein